MVIHVSSWAVFFGENQARLAVGELTIDANAEIPELHRTAAYDGPLHDLAERKELGLAHVVAVVLFGRIVVPSIRSMQLHL